MRALLISAVSLLALALVGCGGGQSAGPATTATPTLREFDSGELAAYEQAVFATLGTGGSAADRQAAIDGATTAGLIAIDNPEATYPSVVAPGVDHTARTLLEWVAVYGNPEPALAAQEALDILP